MAFSLLKKSSRRQQQQKHLPFATYITTTTTTQLLHSSDPIPTFPDYLLYFVEGSRNHPTARKLMLLLTMCFFLYLSWANW